MRKPFSYLRHRLARILLHTDMSFVEFSMSLCYFGWAALLLWLRPDLFDTNRTFNDFEAHATQIVWGVTILSIGLTKFLGVMLDWRWFRLVGAIMGTALWSFISVAFWGSTGMVIYAVFTFSCFFTALRHARLGRENEKDRVL